MVTTRDVMTEKSDLVRPARTHRPLHGHQRQSGNIASVSAYCSATVLVPDALGVLDNVEINR